MFADRGVTELRIKSRNTYDRRGSDIRCFAHPSDRIFGEVVVFLLDRVLNRNNIAFGGTDFTYYKVYVVVDFIIFYNHSQFLFANTI